MMGLVTPDSMNLEIRVKFHFNGHYCVILVAVQLLSNISEFINSEANKMISPIAPLVTQLTNLDTVKLAISR